MTHSLAPEARADLDEIWLYLARESGREVLADAQIDAIADRFYVLAEYPHVGRARDADLGLGMHSFQVGDYVIVYEVNGMEILILRVVHGRRDLIALFEGGLG
jgi:toxin ParE1/3/4